MFAINGSKELALIGYRRLPRRVSKRIGFFRLSARWQTGSGLSKAFLYRRKHLWPRDVFRVLSYLLGLFCLRLRRNGSLDKGHIESGQSIVRLESLHMPKLDHLFPFV